MQMDCKAGQLEMLQSLESLGKRQNAKRNSAGLSPIPLRHHSTALSQLHVRFASWGEDLPGSRSSKRWLPDASQWPPRKQYLERTSQSASMGS